jgi:hypothetical protein
MKRIATSIAVLALSGMFGATQLVARDKHKDKEDHRGVNATELAGVGIIAAAMVGGAGYLLLRRRTRFSK